jgi:hypothetical protein
MHGRVAVLALAGLALTAAPARATVPVGNLVVNPGAEASAGAPDNSTIDPPQGWTTTAGELTAVQYGASGGFPTTADGAAVGGGANFFAGGNASESAATQVIDVSQAAPEIDAGLVSATLSALEGGWAGQDDYATVTLRYLDASGQTLADLISLAPVTPADRNGVTELLPRSDAGKVPAGTRALRVTIDSVQPTGQGPYDDGYVDNVSLTLSAPTVTPAPTPSPSPTPAPTPTPTPSPTYHHDVVVQPSGTVKVRKPGTSTFVTVSGAAEIPLGSTVDTTHGTVVLSSVPKPGAPPQSATFYAGIFKVTQPGGITQLALAQPLAPCGAHASTAAKKPRTRRLWGDGHGAFRTTGRYSSATVRGTKWLVQDSCAGTLTRVVRGVIAVRDDVRRRTVVLRAGKKYLARPRRR